ncbi:hypothetical protein PHYPSEUDO_013509 [Phytophthora pseudosyringae]|uniref:RING-type domain-containing protein n=1 Tax=Phytophthora pseudosyringae TaxID=221518 RepID=A0A8T1WIM7_9STRA|nr:hypothetical protein PHYPSEUDO_013509 [Phytophthora pseudosyringae]
MTRPRPREIRSPGRLENGPAEKSPPIQQLRRPDLPLMIRGGCRARVISCPAEPTAADAITRHYSCGLRGGVVPQSRPREKNSEPREAGLVLPTRYLAALPFAFCSFLLFAHALRSGNSEQQIPDQATRQRMEVTVRVEVHYCTPPDTVLGDVLRLLRSRTWAAFMTRHIGPRLEKVSPVDVSVLGRLDGQWQAQASRSAGAQCSTPVVCVICMDADEGSKCRPENHGVQLPCGHAFHRRCIHSWLQLQSTCPICRWQFPKEFAGSRFVARRLQSTAVLPEHIRSWSRASIAHAPVGGHSVRVVVSLTLAKALPSASCGRVPCPCELTAILLDETSGEMFSEMDTQLATVRCHLEAPWHRIVSTRFALVEAEAKFSDVPEASSCVARETGRKRRCFRRQTETSKRQRVSE